MKANWIVFSGLLLLGGCGQQTLYTGLPEKEVNDMVAILLCNNVSCDKVAGAENTWNIVVDKSQFSQGVQLLNEAGYPKDTFISLGDAFKKSGLVSSPTEERVRFIYALSNELSETLTHIHGVVTARVHIVLPDNDPYSDKATPSSASVFISYLPQINLEDCARSIRQLVTNSIEGLSYDKVNLSMFPASNPNDRLPLSLTLDTNKDKSNSSGLLLGILLSLILGILLSAVGIYLWKRNRNQ